MACSTERDIEYLYYISHSKNRKPLRSFTWVGVAQDIFVAEHRCVTVEHGHICDYITIESTKVFDVRNWATSSLEEGTSFRFV